MSLKELEGTLKDLEGQCVALERAEAEREAAKSAIAKLEAEAAEAESTIEKLKARIGRERGGDAVAGSGHGERALRRRGQSQAERPDNEEAERDHGEEHADAPLRRADTLARATEDAGFRDAERVLHVAGVALAHEE